MAVKPIPEGYHTATPYLIVDGAAAAIDYYVKAFDATELFRMPMGDKVGHAEIKVGDKVRLFAPAANPQLLERFCAWLREMKRAA